MPRLLRVGMGALGASCGLLLASAALGAEPPSGAPGSAAASPATSATLNATPSAPALEAVAAGQPAPPAPAGRAAAPPTTQREEEPDGVRIARLEAIPRVERRPRHWLSLARAYVRQRQLLEANDAYEQLRRGGAGQLIASEHLQAQLLLPLVSIRVVGPRNGDARVFVDSHPLPQPGDTSGHPVNPGWHTFVVEVEGQATAAERLYVEEGAREFVQLSTFAASPAAHPTDSSRQPTDASALPNDGAGKADSWVPTYVSLGVATAASVATAVFAVRANQARARSGSLCRLDPERPDLRLCESAVPRDELRQQLDEFHSAANATTISGLIALAGLGSAVTFWLLHDDGESSTELALSPRGVQLSGSF